MKRVAFPTLFLPTRRSRDRSHASLWIRDLQERGVTRVHHSLIISSALLCRSPWLQLLDPVTL